MIVDSTRSASSHSLPELPQEMIDLIIDWVAADWEAHRKLFPAYRETSTILACSLVARSWVPRCQKHIHRRAAIDFDDGSSWCALEMYGNSRLLQLVRHLAIRRLRIIRPNDDLIGPRPGSDDSTNLANLMLEKWRILSGCTNITELTLTECDGQYFDSHRLTEIASLHRSVTTLNLFWCSFPTVDDHLRFILSFENLSVLRIWFGPGSIKSYKIPSQLQHQPRQKLRLAGLTLTGPSHGRSVDRLLPCIDLRGLTSLNMSLLPGSASSSHLELLGSVGRSLSHLILDLTMFKHLPPERT